MRQSQDSPNGSEVQGSTRFSRRQFLTSAAVFSVVTGVEVNQASAAAGWTSYESPASGASINIPSGWQGDQSAPSDLLYPHQSFAVRGAPGPSTSADFLPDLRSYPTDAMYLWLLHYDSIGDEPKFRGFSGVSDLPTRNSEFAGFTRYHAPFSGSQRSFLLFLWVGVNCSETTLSFLNQSLASLTVP